MEDVRFERLNKGDLKSVGLTSLVLGNALAKFCTFCDY